MMHITDLVNRASTPNPWEEGENIPWSDPEFSRRMLREHLSQEHDAASRRFEIIDRQVEWIHSSLLDYQSAKILDLACGPGLYSERLARLGHTCQGIDYSPASIEYAKSISQRDHLSCSYFHADIRQANFPQGVNLVMLIYGEFNVFRRLDAKAILEKAWRALEPNGWLLLEPHPYDVVRQLGEKPASWYSSHAGLFSDQPHLVLRENFWDENLHTATMRYYIIEARSGEVTRYAQSMQAYRDDEYRSLLSSQGFHDVQILPGL
ncbi:MAG TPA: class I SAM-dependent methyltransferase, partial [Anaerolineales bacterium]|nr:class I SAM-dependent methyltransferase [Anaerolineales bacterium]